jgi:hypothetical protein
VGSEKQTCRDFPYDRQRQALPRQKALATNVGRLPGLFGWLESSISVQLPRIKLESFSGSELGF